MLQDAAERQWGAASIPSMIVMPDLREAAQERQRREAAAKEQARRDAAAARKQTTDARTQAEQAGARERWSQEFAQARQLTTQGHTCEERQEFAQALTLYQQATQRFAQLKQDAVLLAARERAETAQRRTAEAKQVPEPLKPWTDKNEKWKDAQRLETAAEQAWQGGEYARAEEQYRQAVQSYALARADMCSGQGMFYDREVKAMKESAIGSCHG